MARNVVSDLARLKTLSASIGRRGRRVLGIPATIRGMVRTAETRVNREGYMERLVQQRFNRMRPYADGGQRWAPRKDPGDGHPLLQDTGRLLQACLRAVRNTYNIIRVRWSLDRVGVEYATFLQNGTDNMKARPFFSDPSKTELKVADNRFMAIVKKMLRRALG